MKRETPEFTEENVLEFIDESEDGKSIQQIRTAFKRDLEETKAMIFALVDQKKLSVGDCYNGNRRFSIYEDSEDKVPPPHRNAFTPEMDTSHGLRLRKLLEARR